LAALRSASGTTLLAAAALHQQLLLLLWVQHRFRSLLFLVDTAFCNDAFICSTGCALHNTCAVSGAARFRAQLPQYRSTLLLRLTRMRCAAACAAASCAFKAAGLFHRYQWSSAALATHFLYLCFGWPDVIKLVLFGLMRSADQYVAIV
jgi:hypothetical protein